MYFILEDPLLAGRKIDPPPVSRPPAAKKNPPFAPELRRFAVSQGAEQHFGFWLLVLGIVAVLALVALIGFGPR